MIHIRTRPLRCLPGAALLVAALGLAQPLAAQSPEAHRQALTAALTGAGCMLSNDNQNEILAASGLTEDQALAALQVLFAEDAVRMEGERLYLVTGDCAEHAGTADDPAERAAWRAAMIAALAEAGCRITPGDQHRVIAASGLTESQAITVLLALAGTGEARMTDDEYVLLIPPCVAEDAGVGATDDVTAEDVTAEDVAADAVSDQQADARVGDSMAPADSDAAGDDMDEMREALMQAIAQFDCQVTEATQDQVLAASGLTEIQAGNTIEPMIDAGEVVITAEGVAVLLVGPCAEGGGSEPAAAAAPTVPAADTEGAELALTIVQAIRANGCAVLDSETDALMATLGAQPDVQMVLRDLIDAGQVATPRVVRGSLLLSEPLCTAPASMLESQVARAMTPAPGPAPAGSRMGGARLFMAELRNVQCLMAESRAVASFEEMGVPDPQAMLERLEAVGLILQHGDTLGGTDIGCTGDLGLVDGFLSAGFQEPKRKP